MSVSAFFIGLFVVNWTSSRDSAAKARGDLVDAWCGHTAPRALPDQEHCPTEHTRTRLAALLHCLAPPSWPHLAATSHASWGGVPPECALPPCSASQVQSGDAPMGEAHAAYLQGSVPLVAHYPEAAQDGARSGDEEANGGWHEAQAVGYVGWRQHKRRVPAAGAGHAHLTTPLASPRTYGPPFPTAPAFYEYDPTHTIRGPRAEQTIDNKRLCVEQFRILPASADGRERLT